MNTVLSSRKPALRRFVPDTFVLSIAVFALVFLGAAVWFGIRMVNPSAPAATGAPAAVQILDPHDRNAAAAQARLAAQALQEQRRGERETQVSGSVPSGYTQQRRGEWGTASAAGMPYNAIEQRRGEWNAGYPSPAEACKQLPTADEVARCLGIR